MPLHADIQVRARETLGLDRLDADPLAQDRERRQPRPKATAAGFYGKPLPARTPMVKNDIEYILFFLRKGGAYRTVGH